jgi:hypothetical protein
MAQIKLTHQEPQQIRNNHKPIKMNTENQLKKIISKLSKIERHRDKESEKSLSDFISESQAKKLLTRGTTWFWNLRKEGFPSTKLGGENYYDKKDLIAYFEMNRRGGESDY